jgi:hypothetical protein
MSTNEREIANHAGGLLYSPKTGRSRRMSRAHLSYLGICMAVDYTTGGGFSEDAYVEDIKSVMVGNQDIYEILSKQHFDALKERIETSWDIEDFDR